MWPPSGVTGMSRASRGMGEVGVRAWWLQVKVNMA